jgi:hypothetical protein
VTTFKDVIDLFERVRRLDRRIVVTDGPGVEWTAEVPGFGTQTYRITGMKSPQELEDDVKTLAIWVWSLKDYIKELLISQGRDGKKIEAFVDLNPVLQVCADIANSEKHSVLRKPPRSGQKLRAGQLKFSIPQSAMSSITFFANEVQVDVSQPELVTIDVPVLDAEGNVIGDAIAYLRTGIFAWEMCARDLGVAV